MPDLQLYYRTGETNSMGLSINTDMPTKRTKAPETNPPSCSCFSKGVRAFTGKASSSNRTSTCGRTQLDLHLSPYTKIYSKWSKDPHEDLQLLDCQSRCRQNTSNTCTGKGFLKRTTGCWEKNPKNWLTGSQDGLLHRPGKHQQTGESLQDRKKRLPSISYPMCLLHVSCLPLDTNWEWAEPMSPEFPIPKTTESSFCQNPPNFGGNCIELPDGFWQYGGFHNTVSIGCVSISSSCSISCVLEFPW